MFNGQSDSLCNCEFERTYFSESIESFPVYYKRVRGILFKPKNGRSFPGIIDMFGLEGFATHRGALLASRGLTVLCLAYFNYEDLPKTTDFTDLDYFQEAVDYMISSTFTSGDSIGLLGSSHPG
jgi:acyl-coenzyme A thioesterase 1/2/4